MDPFSQLKKSFKSQGSIKHLRTGTDGAGRVSHEELPILSDPAGSDSGDSRNPNEVSNATEEPNSNYEPTPSTNSRNRRQNSYEFWMRDKEMGSDQSFDFLPQPQSADPTPRISQFVNKQRNSDEIALDVDMEIDELKNSKPPSNYDYRFSNSSQLNDSVRRRYKDSSMEETQSRISNQQNQNEVLTCSSNASFKKGSSFLAQLKTKSRLIDPPEEEVELIKSGLIAKSGQLRSGTSGLLGSKLGDDDEDDPLADEDLPEKYRRAKCDFLTLLEWVSLILIVSGFICSLLIPYLNQMILWKLKLWKWLVMVLVLICGRLVSGWGIRMIVFFIEMNFLLRKKVLYFVYGVRMAVRNCLWLGMVLVSWHILFDKNVERETDSKLLPFITKILVCFLIGNLLWLVKTLIVKVLASSFHVSTYFDRIQETLFNQYVIETLSGPPVIELQQLEEEEARTELELRDLQNAGVNVPQDLREAAFPTRRTETKKAFQKTTTFVLKNGGLNSEGSKKEGTKEETGISIEDLHKLNSKNISAWNMKRLMKMVRHGTLSTLDEQLLQGDYPNEDDSSKQITSEREAKAAARKIFQNVARPGSKFIVYQDLMRFMRDDEALKAMSLFEGARETKRITKKSLKDWVVDAFRGRRALALTLNDTKTAVNKLHHMVNCIAAIIIIVIWLVILGIATSQFLLFISSQLVLVAFVFGNTCRTIFESIIFLFIMHPYDVGDRCEIDGIQMVVEEMNILTTIFLRWDNLKITYPNSVLSTMRISNFYRSPDMGDEILFCIHVATPAEKVALMKQRIISYIENKKEHWYPSPMVVFKDVEELNMVRMALWMNHRMNHQNVGEKWTRRGLLVEEMVKIFKDLDIQYRMHPFDINVVSMPAITSTRYPATWSPETSAQHQ